MSLALPILIGMMPLDQMMSIFVVGGSNLPVATQIQFTSAIALVFRLSVLLTVPAIIISALRGTDDANRSRAQDN